MLMDILFLRCIAIMHKSDIEMGTNFDIGSKVTHCQITNVLEIRIVTYRLHDIPPRVSSK